jgi:hypothetical protein
MSTPINAMVSGTFSTPATLVPVNIPLPCGFDYIQITNVTDYTAHAATIIKAEGYSSQPAASAVVYTGSGANPNVITETILLTDGFTFVSDSGNVALGAPVAVTGLSNATPAVLTSAYPGIAGDVVRLYGTTGMLQVAGMDFTVTVQGGATQNLGFLPAAGFGAAATAGFVRKVSFDPRYYPRRRFITAISQANPAVVQLSVLHDFNVGEKVRIVVPAAFGMPEINGYLATITAVAKTLGTGTNTITLDIDSSAFTAFAFPTSAVAATGVTFAQVVPVGEAVEAPYGLLSPTLDATLNKSFSGVQIGTGVLVASKNYSYIARKGIAI